jgi:methionine-rich copper-binding protein CopC
MRTIRILLLGVTIVLLQASPALSHAERAASTPKEGARVATPPEELRVTFTEPPTGDASVTVLDECGRDVVSDIEVQNFEITATLSGGQPGRWRVETNVISAVDGHNTRDRWLFDVRGAADCSAEESDAPDAGGDDEEEEGSSSMPLILLGAATLVLIALGLVIRGRSS